MERFDDLGRQWLHGEKGTENCYHCQSEEFVNWHTGERRQGANLPSSPLPVDLDDPGVRRLRAGTLAARGATRVVGRAGGPLELQTLGHRTRILTHCARECFSVVLDRDHAAWIQRVGHGARARWTVRSALVHSGWVTTWPLPRQRCALGDMPVAAFADGGLYVSGCRAPRLTGRRPLYHAR